MAMESTNSQVLKKHLTGNNLKLIAIIAMLIDHIAHTIVYKLYLKAIVVDGVHMCKFWFYFALTSSAMLH